MHRFKCFNEHPKKIVALANLKREKLEIFSTEGRTLTTMHIVVLALIQAFTEFLPVSSSGHLGLAAFFFGWNYQGITFDLALHFGTLMAVVAYYMRDLARLSKEFIRIRPGQVRNTDQNLAIWLICATIPAALVGVLMGEDLAAKLRHPILIASNLIVFGLLLGLADRQRVDRRESASLTFKDAMWIGLAQAIALVPGVSRSGITLTAGLALGLTRPAAARFSFLLSIPITTLAVAHGGLQLYRSQEPWVWTDFVLGASIAFFAGLACIHILLAILRRIGTQPFVIYRVLLGLTVFAFYWWRLPS